MENALKVRYFNLRGRYLMLLGMVFALAITGFIAFLLFQINVDSSNVDLVARIAVKGTRSVAAFAVIPFWVGKIIFNLAGVIFFEFTDKKIILTRKLCFIPLSRKQFALDQITSSYAAKLLTDNGCCKATSEHVAKSVSSYAIFFELAGRQKPLMLISSFDAAELLQIVNFLNRNLAARSMAEIAEEFVEVCVVSSQQSE